MAEGGVDISYGNTRSGNSEFTFKALETSYETLVDCIARSPGEITDKLIPIFSKSEMSDLRSSRLGDREKARKIVDTVMSKVESEPSFYKEFTSIMEKEIWMKSCTDVLKANLKGVQKSNSTNINSTSINSTSINSTNINEPTTVETANSGPITPDPGTPPVTDIYTHVSSDESRPVTMKKQFNESDLENRTKDIQQEFASVVTSIAMALKKEGVTTEDLVFHLRELRSVCSDSIKLIKIHYFCTEFITKIEEECRSNVCRVFTVLENYYSWINFGLIKSIKNAFLKHNDVIQTQWAQYQTHYKEYCKERVCKIPKPINRTRILPKFLQKSTKVAFKIDCEWCEIRFDRLNSIRASIQRLLDLQSYTLYLRSVKQGCVELVFEVPQHVADVIFPPKEKQLLALQEHNITYCATTKELTRPVHATPSAGMNTLSPLVGPTLSDASGAGSTDYITVDHIMTVFEALIKARNKWYYIGEGLGLTPADLYEIRDQHHSDNMCCLHNMLQRRIQRGGLTRSMLCTSLRQRCVQRDDVAETIESLTLK